MCSRHDYAHLGVQPEAILTCDQCGRALPESEITLDAFDGIVCPACAVAALDRPADTFYQVDLPVVRFRGLTPRAWLPEGDLILTTSAQLVRVPYIGRATAREIACGIGGVEPTAANPRHDAHEVDYGARWAEALRGGRARTERS